MNHTRLVRNVFLICFIIAIAYPLLNIYFIFPSFSGLIVENTETEATRIASHMSSMVVSENNGLKSPADVKKVSEEMRMHLQLMKLKVFSPTGEVIYSSNPDEIGTINDKSYFHEIVSRGDPYTKVVKKNSKSLEGQVLTLDVVETYIPIMAGQKFIGAFEIYYDITSRTQRLHNIVLRSSLIPIVLMAIFLVIFITMLVRSDGNSIDIQKDDVLAKHRSPYYSLLFITISIFLAESVVMMLIDKLPSMPALYESLFDSSLLVLFVSPALYFTLLRPLIRNISERREIENQLRQYTDSLEELAEERSLALSQSNFQLEKENKKLKQLQNDLLQVQKMDSIGRLAGGIAHDFNNILSVIIGFSEIALDEMPGNGVVQDHIKTIHGAGEKAAMLTKQLLAFSRKQVLEMKAVNINNTIENMTTMLGRLIPANITFEFNSQVQEQYILADPVQLEQILLNLVVNGRDAMPDGGLLNIETTDVEFQETHHRGNEELKQGSYVKLSVTDTGIGMNKDVVDKIFEPFFSTKGVGKGTGMGLSTVYGIVKQHNAHVVVDSEINKGTTFTIYFPVTEEVPEETCEDNPVGDVRGNETVLVVDDEPLILKVIVSLLKPLGYNLLQASSGESALWESDKFQGNIDLLLTDVVMPGINGNELAERLTEKRPGINIIFMSGYTDDSIAQHGVLEEGVVLVNKPIKRDVLAGRIREVLDGRPDQKGDRSSAHELHGLDILLVDDNENIRQLIQVFLKDHDCTFDTAENGKDALEKFSAGTYDLVLMDMQMPVMDGLTAVREMRKREHEKGAEETMVIAMTGNSSEEDIKDCYQAGYSAHLSKPIKKDRLINAVIENSSPRFIPECDTEEIHGEKIIAHVDPDLKDLIPGYLKKMHNDINRIREAVKVKDYETLKIVGHTLKGSGGGYGFDPITDFGHEIEASAKEEDYDNIEKNTNKLSDYIENVEIVYE